MEKQIENLIARLKAIHEEQGQIENEADLKSAGKIEGESLTKYEALQAEYEGKLEEKTELERQLALRNSRQERTARKELEAAVLPRRTQVTAAAPLVPVAALPQPIEREAGHDGASLAGPSFKIPRGVIRNRHLKNFHGTIDGVTAEERAYRLGMWCLARISACIPGRFGNSFNDAKKFVNDYMQATNTAQGETGGISGGEFLVPEEFSSDIIVLRELYGVARKIFQRSVMTTDVKHEPKRNTGLTAFFVTEGQAGTESNMTWSDVQLIAKDLMCLSRISNQLSMDAVINVGDTIAGEMAYAFTNKEDDCAFNGLGTSTYGGITGIRYNLLNGTDNAAQSVGLINGTGSGWSGLVLADFNNVVGALPIYATNDNTCWVTHKAFYNGVMQRLELAAGGNTLMTIREGDKSNTPLFLGWPVVFSQIWPASTAAGVMAAFGDFSQGAIFGDRQQTSIAFSEHAVINGQSVFEQNQIAVRATERMDIQCHGCGTSALVGPICGIKCG